jgi:hypothetical protein
MVGCFFVIGVIIKVTMVWLKRLGVTKVLLGGVAIAMKPDSD